MEHQKLISWKTVREKVPFGRTKVWELAKDGGFPKPVQISPRRVAWVEAEIDAWIAARVAERDQEVA